MASSAPPLVPLLLRRVDGVGLQASIAVKLLVWVVLPKFQRADELFRRAAPSV